MKKEGKPVIVRHGNITFVLISLSQRRKQKENEEEHGKTVHCNIFHICTEKASSKTYSHDSYASHASNAKEKIETDQTRKEIFSRFDDNELDSFVFELELKSDKE